MLADPAAVRDVFRGDADALHSGEGNEFLTASVGRHSVLVLDGDPHARQRRVLQPPLKGERMRAFVPAMHAETEAAVRRFPRDRPFPILDPMQDVTLRVILRVVFGLVPGPRMDEVAAAVARVMALGRGRHGLILLKLLPVELLQRNRWLPFHRRMHELDREVFALVAEQRAVPAADRGESVLSDLLAATHADGSPLSDQEVRDAVVTLVFAGHDTTSIALAWAFEQILPRPDVVERIADEWRRVTGGGPPTADHLGRLDYLDADIREALRVRTVLPFAVRLTKRPFAAGGREYSAGVHLCPCSHLTHQREDLYPDPHAFRPDRFLERKYAAHEWYPFGGGGRMCLGLTFALTEMKVVLGTVLSSVRLVRPPGSRSVPVRRGIALAPADGTMASVAR